LGGILAGVVNTLAGNGSAITLSILTELIGLPGNLANGTNRVGILAQSFASNWRFHQNGKLKLSHHKASIVWIVIGAFIGIYTATQVSNEGFKEVFKYLMIIMLFVLLIKPKSWLQKGGNEESIHPALRALVGLPLGFYGGFIQMGMGVFLLMIMVLVFKQNIMKANILKVFVVGFYTAFALLIFALNDMVDWKIGGIIAVGQFAGGWFAAEFGSKWRHAEKFSYYLLVTVVSIVCIRLILQSL